jgi:hypothetical protein
MLAFVLLATLGQLPPDPSSLPPPLDPRLILTRPADRDMDEEKYRAFLRIEPEERRAGFARLTPDDRSTIMRRHLWLVMTYYEPTDVEKNLLWNASLAATPAAYAGDAIAGKALNDAERKMTQNLSPRLLAIVRELLSPPPKSRIAEVICARTSAKSPCTAKVSIPLTFSTSSRGFRRFGRWPQ